MNAKTTKSINDFKREMGENPLGTREAIKMAGPYIVELYRDVIGDHRRRREGQAPAGVVEVYERVPENEDYYRNYRRVGHLFADSLKGARDAYKSLDGSVAAEEWIETHPDDE